MEIVNEKTQPTPALTETVIPKTMDIKQFSVFSGFSDFFVRKNIKTGLIVAIKIDSKYRVMVDETMDNLKAYLVAPAKG